MAKLVKIAKNDEIVEVIKHIKTLKGDEVVFDIPGGSKLFRNPHNFSLIKKSAAAIGKTVIIKTDDPNGMSMVTKAGLLLDEDGAFSQPVVKGKVKKVKFADIGASSISKQSRPAPIQSARKLPSIGAAATAAKKYIPEIPSIAKPKVKFPRISSAFSRNFVLAAVVLVLVVFGLAVLLPQASITVYARSEPISRDLELTVDKGLKTINSSRLAIPGEAVTKEISNTKNFPTTGVKLIGNKAQGSLQLYNFTKNTLTLRAATTTLIVDGKRYKFVNDVTGLRPTARIGQGQDQEVDPSSLISPVAIIAEEVGANYNIAAKTRLQIQNTALGQADVYGETAAALTGGSSTEIKVLSQADLDKATETMQNELGGLVEREIAAQNPNVKILNNAVKSEILAKTANKEVNDETATFDMTIIARVNALGYNEANVKEIVLEKITSVLSEDKYLPDEGKQELTATFKAVDVDKGTGTLAVHFETVAAYRVENTNMSKILEGKNAIEIKEILLTKPEIDRVDVEFSPFFVNKAPRFNGKIYIKTIESN